ncbi:uncharacterized protein DDB_G0290685-like [Maniola jurtina]|uniref:uncharacterized protein DDB_G0290685-like n=1 Tax=Maniola jurtina TaxID=191418 RepID=UPI001E68C79E|nr:uncharacterized protein DDB_G0290685-like [Maniola jurtina]
MSDDTAISPGYIQRDNHPDLALGSVSDDFDIPTKSDGEDFPKLTPHGKQSLKRSHYISKLIPQNYDDVDKQKHEKENYGSDNKKLTRRLNDAKDDDKQKRAEESNDYGDNEEQGEGLNEGDKQEFDDEEDGGRLNDANDEQVLDDEGNDDGNQKRAKENNDYGNIEEQGEELNEDDKQQFDDEEDDSINQQRTEENHGDSEKPDVGLDNGDNEELEESDDEDIEKNNHGEAKNQEMMELGDMNDGSRENFDNIVNDTKMDKTHQKTEELKDSMFDAEYDETEENEVNFVEYKDNCPKECPARQVMVCARCQHNIHRTFLSICHLRMFNCQHPNEKLELVSRQPCVQSAPFLTGFPTAKAKISAPGDQDTVLKFIRCREKERLERDPRCAFRQK